MADDNDNEMPQHPALKEFSGAQARMFEAKHVVGKTLKGAAIGAAIAGAAVAGAVIMGGPLAWGVATVGSVIGFGVPAALGAVAVGAGIGGLIGLATSHPGQAREDEEEKLIANYERGEARQRKLALLDQRTRQQEIMMEQQRQSLGLSPGQVPYGRGSEGRTV